MATLYHCAGSRGLRALWAIEEVGAVCDLVLLPFPPRARAKQFLEINPLGTIPAFEDDGYVMTESSAIAHYVAAKHGSNLVVSPDEDDYAAYLDFLHHADATLTFPQTVYLRFAVMEKERGLEEAGVAYADWFGARLTKVRRRLADRGYLCAGRFTVADIAVTYALLLAARCGLERHLTDDLRAFADRMTARPAFQRALVREKPV
jgi:glutathione S-transferase